MSAGNHNKRAEEVAQAAKGPPPLAINGGRRVIKRLIVELDDGTQHAWNGTGSITLVGTAKATASRLPVPHDIFFAEAILKYDPPAKVKRAETDR